MNKIQPLALGVAIGVLWAVYVACAAIMAMFNWGGAFVVAMASFYIGYSASLAGALIGAVWALIDGFVAGVAIAWIYNSVAK